jgi:hypothetical protein
LGAKCVCGLHCHGLYLYSVIRCAKSELCSSTTALRW